ncbi:MAG: DinB family protein [Phaeodactylibacter sp.]|nr:DinB family protein [Phaeodactylibacter sp.]
MTFDLQKSIEILSRTPSVLEALLAGVCEDWWRHNEGENTWSPFDIVGHLIHGEQTDWIPRAKIILSDAQDKTFKPFDRFAQFQAQQGKSMDELLQRFKTLRAANLKTLEAFNLNVTHWSLTGMHPELGPVTLKELLSTWVVHDLGHIAQVSRVMAKQYGTEVGAWTAYLGILNA